jgi:hypothetical protein
MDLFDEIIEAFYGGDADEPDVWPDDYYDDSPYGDDD